MDHTRAPVHVVLVDPDGRLEPVAATLRSEDDAITTVCVPAAADARAASEDGTVDCVVVLDAPGVDGLAQLAAVRPLVDEPVIVFSIDNHPDLVRRALDAGAADVVCVSPDRSSLLTRRVRYAAGKGEPFQTPTQRLESLLEHLPHQVFIKDDEGRIADVSRVTADEYGMTREGMVGLTDFELFPPELASDLYEEERRLMATGEPIINKVEHYVDGDDRDRWVSTSKAVRYDGDRVVGVLGTVRDVTEEKRQEKMMTVLHEASRDLVGADGTREVASVAADIAADIPDLPRLCIVLTDGDDLVAESGDEGVFEEYREAFHRAFAAEAETVLASDGERVSGTGDGATSADPAVAVLPLGEHGVLGFAARGGSLDEFSLDLATVLAANVEVAFDRAERERRLRAQNERLEEFASLVSHDLRNPMSTARGYLEAYRESGDPAHADEIERALDRMDRLTEEVLDLARHGRTVDEFEPIDLGDAVDRAWDGVPTASATLDRGPLGVVMGDGERIVEALENLIRNAIEHAGETATVAVERTPTGFALADDGPGIPDDEKPSVFDLGYTNADEGTGYGLYIVDQIAAAHGWTVSVTDADGGGARFEFSGLDVRDGAA